MANDDIETFPMTDEKPDHIKQQPANNVDPNHNYQGTQNDFPDTPQEMFSEVLRTTRQSVRRGLWRSIQASAWRFIVGFLPLSNRRKQYVYIQLRRGEPVNWKRAFFGGFSVFKLILSAIFIIAVIALLIYLQQAGVS